MKVLLLSLGNSPARYKFVQNHIENFVDRGIAGHEIITFGYNDGVDIKINVGDNFSKVIDGLPDKWSPDFCLLWEVEWNLLPLGIEDASFPTISLLYDIDYDIPLAKACVESTDLTISLAEKEQVKIRAIGADNVEVYYYIGMMKELVCPSPKKIKERKYDIFYTTWINDHEYPDRSKWILKLSALSEKYNVLIESHLPSYKAYIEMLRDSKLVFSHNRFGSMSGRVLEAASQGTVVIETGTEVKKHFDSEREFISVNEDNFIDQIEKYLRDDKYLQEMSDRAYEKVVRNYESRARFAGLLGFIGDQLGSRSIEIKTGKLTEGEKFNRRGEVYYYAYFRTVPGSFIMNAGKLLLELSIEELKKAAAIAPTPRHLTNLAVAETTYCQLFPKEMTLNEKGGEIIALLEKVICIHPDYIMAYYHLGVVQLKIGNSGEALKIFHKTLGLLRDHKSYLDPWCLHNKDDYVFNQLIKRNLNEYLMSLCQGDDSDALTNIRKLYQAVIIYYIAGIEEASGHLHEALEHYLDLLNLHQGTGQIISKAGSMLAALDYKDESILMFEKAIVVSPLTIEYRDNLIKHLYVYGRDKEVVEKTREAMKLIRTISALKEKSVLLRETMCGLTRLNSNALYSYDICKEALLNGYADIVFEYLKKDPGNINLIINLVNIWSDTGRTESLFDLVDEYMEHHFKHEHADDETRAFLARLYETLRELSITESRMHSEKIAALRSGIKGIRDKKVHCPV